MLQSFLLCRCSDGTCVLSHQRCDGFHNCNDDSDETNCVAEDICKPVPGYNFKPTLEACYSNCSEPQCQCNELYFQCKSAGGCIPLSKLCNLNPDCPDGSDELICNHKKCTINQDLCHDGQCYEAKKKCDFVRDCLDNTDELDCEFHKGCPVGRENVFSCTNGTCMPKTKMNDLIPDCPGNVPKDEMDLVNVYRNGYVTEKGLFKSVPNERSQCEKDLLRCSQDVGRCVERHKTCVYDLDRFGDLKYCRTGGHLTHCEKWNCGAMFKCPSSYCLPLQRVCDGVQDCPDAADEAACNNLYCPGRKL